MIVFGQNLGANCARHGKLKTSFMPSAVINKNTFQSGESPGILEILFFQTLEFVVAK